MCSPVDEEERNKIDAGIAMYFTRFGGFVVVVVFVDLWEEQFCLWDQNDLLVS